MVWFTGRPANGKSTLATALRPILVYRQAQAGQIANFTGLSDPYEEPEHPAPPGFAAAARLDTHLSLSRW
jgi:adenylylsulfate kinase-like enzyme